MTPEEALDLLARWIGARLLLIDFDAELQYAVGHYGSLMADRRRLIANVEAAGVALVAAGLAHPLTKTLTPR